MEVMLYYVVIMYIMTDKVFAENNRDKNDVDFLKQLENTFGHKIPYYERDEKNMEELLPRNWAKSNQTCSE